MVCNRSNINDRSVVDSGSVPAGLGALQTFRIQIIVLHPKQTTRIRSNPKKAYRTTIISNPKRPCIWRKKVPLSEGFLTHIMVHKVENFLDSDFGISVISLLVMHK